jgi:hypothetical protein
MTLFPIRYSSLRSLKSYNYQTRLNLNVFEDLKKKSGDEDFFNVAALTTSANPKLVYNGGRLLQNVDVFTIFWGANWANTPSYKTLAQNINKQGSIP